MIKILSIGIDRSLLERDGLNEAQHRQLAYAAALPARIVHLVKAPADGGAHTVDLPAERGSVQVVPVAVPHWSLFPLAALRAGGRLLAGGGFDLVQAQEPHLSGPIALMLARRYGLPLSVGAFSDIIDNDGWVGRNPLRVAANVMAKAVYRRASGIRADSAEVAAKLKAIGFPQAEFIPFLITNEKAFVTPTAEAGVTRNTLLGGATGPLLVTALRVEEEKNLPLLLSAFRAALAQFPGLRLAIAGEGSLRTELQNWSRSNIGDAVRWLGWVANEKLPAYLQAADLVLLPSNFESSARILTEAQLAGTAVLTTDTAGAREAVSDGETGRVVPVGDGAAFTQALMDLVSSPQRLAEFGEEARKRAIGRFGRDYTLSRLRQHYQGCLS